MLKVIGCRLADDPSEGIGQGGLRGVVGDMDRKLLRFFLEKGLRFFYFFFFANNPR